MSDKDIFSYPEGYEKVKKESFDFIPEDQREEFMQSFLYVITSIFA